MYLIIQAFKGAMSNTRSSEPPLSIVVRAIFIAAGVVILLWVLYLIRDLLLLIYISGMFAIGLAPLVRAIERPYVLPFLRWHPPRWLTILAIYMIVLAFFGLLIFLVVPPITEQASAFSRDLPTYLERAQVWITSIAAHNHMEIDLQRLGEEAFKRVGELTAPLVSALFGFLGVLFGIFTILMLTFYLLLDYEHISKAILNFFPREQRDRVHEVFDKIGPKISGWLAGQFLVALIIGTTTAIALPIIGIPYFYLFALLAAIGEVVPVIGPIMAAIPPAIVALFISPWYMITVIAFFTVQQQLESNLLVPRLMQRQVGIDPVVVIIALLIGAKLLGILGAILAIPTAGIIQVVLSELYNEETQE